MKRGGVAFDEFKSDESLLAKHDLWLAVLKNIRAGLMPPAKKPQPRAEERQRLEHWIKFDAFAIDPQNLDPGRVTTRAGEQPPQRHLTVLPRRRVAGRDVLDRELDLGELLAPALVQALPSVEENIWMRNPAGLEPLRYFSTL